MRLYAKLLTMILLFAAIQHVAAPSCAWGRDAWFALRCQAADMLGDEALAANLVDEYYNNNRRIDPELVREIELQQLFASPGADDDGVVDDYAGDAPVVIDDDEATVCAT